MITSITIENFKGIESLTLRTGTINIVVGSNSAGKSSIAQAVLFSVSVAQGLASANIRWRDSQCSMSLAPTELPYLPTNEVSALATDGRFTEAKAIRIRFEAQLFAESDSVEPYHEVASVAVKKGRGQHIQCSISGLHIGKQLQSTVRPYAIYVPGISGIVPTEELRSVVAVRRLAARGDSNLVLRNVLRLLSMGRRASTWTAFLRDLRALFPGTDIEVSVTAKDEFVRVYVIRGTSRIPLESGGTGFLQIVQLLAYFHLWRPRLLVLDEPDSHLHADNQQRLANLIVSLCEEYKVQALIATHSRHLVEAFGTDATVHWIRNHKLVEHDSSTVLNALLDIGALSRAEALLAGHKKVLVLAEDGGDQRFIEGVLQSSGFNLGDCEIWCYKGCTKLDAIETFVGFATAYIDGLKILIHRDRDYLTDDAMECYLASLRAISPDITLWVPRGTSIEYAFTTVDYLSECNRQINIEHLVNLRQRALDEVREFSISTMINARTEAEGRIARKERRPVDHGMLSLSCIEEYNKDVESLVHAKRLHKALKRILHKEGLALSSTRIMKSLDCSDLRSFADKVWQRVSKA